MCICCIVPFENRSSQHHLQQKKRVHPYNVMMLKGRAWLKVYMTVEANSDFYLLVFGRFAECTGEAY